MPKSLIVILTALATIGLTIVYSASTDGFDNLVFLPYMTRQHVEAIEPTPSSLAGQVAALATRVATLEAQTATLSKLLTPTPTPIPTPTPVPVTLDRFMALGPDVAWWKVYKPPSRYSKPDPSSPEASLDIAAWLGKALLAEQTGQAIPSPEVVFRQQRVYGDTRLTTEESATIKNFPAGSLGFRIVNDPGNALSVCYMAMGVYLGTRSHVGGSFWDSLVDGLEGDCERLRYNFLVALQSDPIIN